ncbi:hypothetical protein BC827DRAFT_1265636 [Russula dissimulans]|nr:hypothetical protein BC827DRAFT_1265636 [Russula dissimulans]
MADGGPSAQSLQVATNFRVASMSIAAYDYLITLPSEVWLYKTASPRSLGLILFVLIRYSSVIIIVVSNTGFFYRHFTPESCARYCYLAPVFKVFQIMVSQAILGIRAYNISQRKTWVGRLLLSVYIVAVGLEWFADFYRRFTVMIDSCPIPIDIFPSQDEDLRTSPVNCLETPEYVSLSSGSVSVKPYPRPRLLYDGLGYFVVLTAINLMNIFLFRGASVVTETSGASLAYSITWIMSQRILLHPREASSQDAEVLVSRIPTIHLRSLRFHGERRHENSDKADENLTKTQLQKDSDRDDNSTPEFDLAVRIEKSTVTDAIAPDGEHSDRSLYATSPSPPWDSVPDYHAAPSAV